MKKNFSLVAILATMLMLLPAAFAQQDQSQPSSSTPSAQQPSSQQPSSPATSSDQGSAASAAQSSSFNGTVVNAGGKYVLKADNGTTYQLDDQDKAKQYENKQVKVSGNLDSSTSTLHITDINPMQ